MSHDLLLFPGLKRKQSFLFLLLLRSVLSSFHAGGGRAGLVLSGKVNCFCSHDRGV